MEIINKLTFKVTKKDVEKFADEFGKSKAWAWLLICKPEKVRIIPEFQDELSEVLGVRVVF